MGTHLHLSLVQLGIITSTSSTDLTIILTELSAIAQDLLGKPLPLQSYCLLLRTVLALDWRCHSLPCPGRLSNHSSHA